MAHERLSEKQQARKLVMDRWDVPTYGNGSIIPYDENKTRYRILVGTVTVCMLSILTYVGALLAGVKFEPYAILVLFMLGAVGVTTAVRAEDIKMNRHGIDPLAFERAVNKVAELLQEDVDIYALRAMLDIYADREAHVQFPIVADTLKLQIRTQQRSSRTSRASP